MHYEFLMIDISYWYVSSYIFSSSERVLGMRYSTNTH